MRRKSIMSLMLVGIIALTMVAGSESTYAKTETKRQIVVFEKDVGADKKAEILDMHKAVKVKDIKGTNAVVITALVDNRIAEETEVRFVEEDYVISVEGSSSTKGKKPQDPVVDQSEEIVPWGVSYMNDLTPGDNNTGAGIKVGIIDTGIDVDHPDLMANIKGGYNATSKKKSYDDDNGHGTHVAGIIAAVGNEIGIIGVAPEASIYAIKALDASGSGYISDVIEGLEWCVANDMDIINMSLGITNDSAALYESVIKADTAGIIIVAAAGNNYGGNCEYPAAYEEVVGVGAIDVNGDVAEFSAAEGVDAWAPGVDVYSTYLNGNYETLNGTSMAAPHWIKFNN